MIRELRIRNLAIIEELDLNFEPGLVILTGETGAGKSIILGALRLVLGERAASDDVRTGADSAEVEAMIEGPLPDRVMRLLGEMGIPADPDGLILRREVSVSGKGKAVVNGRLAPVGQLKALGDELVDLHGQHQHQSLLNPDNHLIALDAFAETSAGLARVAEAHAVWLQARSDLAKLQGDEKALERERAMLEFQVKEIEQAGLDTGEDERLIAERARLRNAEQLRLAAGRAHGLLSGDDGDGPAVSEMLAQAENEIASLAKLDESQKGSLESLADARFRLEDLAGHLREYAEAAESDPARLSEVEDRLDLIRNLKKKHGGTIEEILDAWEQYDKRLKSLVNREAEIAALEKRLAQAESSLAAAAGELSAKRQAAARRFEKNLQSELAQLQMENAKFSVSFWREEAPEGQGVEFEGRRYFVGPDGVDRLEFLLSANPGEALKPLKRIASGGELSRIMLAIKSLLAQRDGVPTLIFDEIDVGISGATAQVVAEKMRRIADGRQVVCITHLAQIAARASQHFAVEKKKKGKRIVTQVRPLSEPERVEEIARLLGGDAESAVGKKHAQELLRGMNAAAS